MLFITYNLNSIFFVYNKMDSDNNKLTYYKKDQKVNDVVESVINNAFVWLSTIKYM